MYRGTFTREIDSVARIAARWPSAMTGADPRTSSDPRQPSDLQHTDTDVGPTVHATTVCSIFFILYVSQVCLIPLYLFDARGSRCCLSTSSLVNQPPTHSWIPASTTTTNI